MGYKSAAVDKVQKAYLNVLAGSPLLASRKPTIFRKMRSWSPENLAALKKILETQ